MLQRYGVSDDDAFAVGLTCGGILDVFVETVSQETFPELGAVADDIEAGRPVAVATVIDHPDPAWVGRRLVVRPEDADAGADAAPTGSLGSERADAAVTDDARGLLALGRTETLTYGPDGERRGEGMRVFVAAYAPRPRMLVFGAIDFAAAVAHVGSFLGYRVTVCDARPVFATASPLPGCRRGRRRVAAPLPRGRGRGGADRPAHRGLRADPRPEVRRARCSRWPCGCPRSPTSARWARAAPTTTGSSGCARPGVTEAELARLSSPIGLDLGARTPEETAVSIAAEIVALQWGGARPAAPGHRRADPPPRRPEA